jgi:hypothetical protein
LIFFGSTGIWTLGLALTRQATLSIESLHQYLSLFPFYSFFWDRVSLGMASLAD